MSARGLPERTVGPLVDAARGLRLRNASYRAVVRVSEGVELSDLTASRDLKALVDKGLLEAVGATRGRHYVAGAPLVDAWRGVRGRRRDTGDDPFALTSEQLVLPIS